MADRTGGEKIDQQPHPFHRHLRLGLFRARPQMGRDQHARHAKQRTVGAGLLLEDIEGNSGDHTPLEALHQRLLVVDATAGAIDQPHARLEDFEFGHPDQVSRFIRQRSVHREVIDLRQHGRHARHQFDAQLGGPLRRQKRIEAHHAHVEGPGPFGQRLPDAPQPHDPQSLARHLHAHELIAVPAMVPQAGVGCGEIARQRQQQREGMLGGAHGVARRGVHHHDALPSGGVLVDIVGANARPHDGLEAVVAHQTIGSDFHTAAADGAVVLGQTLPQRISRETGGDFVADAGGRGRIQHGQPIGTERVEHDDGGHGISSEGLDCAKMKAAGVPAAGLRPRRGLQAEWFF